MPGGIAPIGFNQLGSALGSGFGTNLGGPAVGGFGTNLPSSNFPTGPFGAGPGPIGINTGPGPRIESFQKDGFKITGREPIKPKNEEG
jgi:hypothetical protein